MVTLVAHWEQRWPDVGLRCLRLWPIQCFRNYTHKVLYLWSCLSREELMRLSLANHMANAPLSSWISTPPSFRLAWFLHRIILSPASYFILSHYQRPNPISTPNYLITWRTSYLRLSHQLLTLHNDHGSFPHWSRPVMPWTYFDHWPRPRRKILIWQSLLSFSSTMGSSRKIVFVVHEGLLLHPKYVVVREISKT